MVGRTQVEDKRMAPIEGFCRVTESDLFPALFHNCFAYTNQSISVETGALFVGSCLYYY